MAIIVAVASTLIVCLRCALIWKLCKMADQSSRSVRISGLNPLAVNVAYDVQVSQLKEHRSAKSSVNDAESSERRQRATNNLATGSTLPRFVLPQVPERPGQATQAKQDIVL